MRQFLGKCCTLSPQFLFMQWILLSSQSLSGCSFFENRHNLIYMYRNFIYISYVCVFTGALLVGCSKQKWEEKGEAIKCFFFFYSILPLCCCFFISVYSLVSSQPQCVCIPSAGDARAAAAALWQGWMTMSHTHSLSLSLLSLSFSHSSLSNSLLPLSLTPPLPLSLSLSHTHTHLYLLLTNERSSRLQTLPFTLLLSLSLCVTDTLLSQFCPTIFLFFLAPDYQNSLPVFFFPSCSLHSCPPVLFFMRSSPFTSCPSNLFTLLWLPLLPPSFIFFPHYY